MAKYFINPASRTRTAHPGLFQSGDYEAVNAYFDSHPELAATPLVHLRALAKSLNIKDILLKNESERFALNSFKILGVTYAVERLISEERLSAGSLIASATDGNHGRAVARAAAGHGMKAKIYVPSDTAKSVIRSIENEHAEVVVVQGTYDHAVREAAGDANRGGWTLVSDTSWKGYEEIPRLIMAGYTRLLREAEQQWHPGRTPDIVFVQAGVGGLACAVASWFSFWHRDKRPIIVVCESAGAESLLESTRAGKPIALPGPFETIMAGLRCGEVSMIAWPVIASIADAFVAVDDAECVKAMRLLGRPVENDPFVFAGASGACGLAALLLILEDENMLPLRRSIGLAIDSRIMLINTEGITDPEIYAKVMRDDQVSPHDFTAPR